MGFSWFILGNLVLGTENWEQGTSITMNWCQFIMVKNGNMFSKPFENDFHLHFNTHLNDRNEEESITIWHISLISICSPMSWVMNVPHNSSNRKLICILRANHFSFWSSIHIYIGNCVNLCKRKWKNCCLYSVQHKIMNIHVRVWKIRLYMNRQQHYRIKHTIIIIQRMQINSKPDIWKPEPWFQRLNKWFNDWPILLSLNHYM